MGIAEKKEKPLDAVSQYRDKGSRTPAKKLRTALSVSSRKVTEKAWAELAEEVAGRLDGPTRDVRDVVRGSAASAQFRGGKGGFSYGPMGGKGGHLRG